MKDLSNYSVLSSQTIMDAIAAIQRNLTRCVIICNPNGKVVGVFSEGDVLRAILQGTDPRAQLSAMIRPSFRYLFTRDMRQAYELFRSHGATLIPVINEAFELTDVITIFDIVEHSRYEAHPDNPEHKG